MQRPAGGLEPAAGLAGARAVALNKGPEGLGMVHFEQVRNLVRRDVVEHEGWSEDEAPGVGEGSLGGAGAPAACRVAKRETREAGIHPLGIVARGASKIGARLLLQ